MGYWKSKPPCGTQINRAHPLCAGLWDCLLFNEGSGRLLNNLANSSFGNTVTSTPVWQATKSGIGAYCSGGSSFDLIDRGFSAAGGLSVRIVFVPISFPGVYTALVDKGTGNLTRQIGIFLNTSGQVQFVMIGNGYVDNILQRSVQLGAPNDLVITNAGAPSCSSYLNGKSLGSFSLNAVPISGTSAPTSLGRNPSGGGTNGNTIYLTYQLWKRVLSPAEIAQLYADPYCMMAAPPLSRYNAWRTATSGGRILSPYPLTGGMRS